MTEHHSSRRANRLKRDAGRSQKLRDKLKEQGIPTTHQINRALTEGFFYQVAAKRNAGIPMKEIHIPAQLVLAYALRILTSKSNGTSQFDQDATFEAIKQRLSRECSTPFRIESLRMLPRDDVTDEN